jgi:DNA repair ATPase RecN
VFADPYAQSTQLRENVSSVITTLPADYLSGNAAALLRILEELQRSFQEELFLVQAVKNLDIRDYQAVDRLSVFLEDYQQRRLFDRERTHCHNIQRIVYTLLPASDTSTDPSISELQNVLQPLMDADNEFIDELDSLVARAVDTVRQIKADIQTSYTQPTGYAPALATQANFLQEFDPRVQRLKTLMKDMNIRINELIDLL